MKLDDMLKAVMKKDKELQEGLRKEREKQLKKFRYDVVSEKMKKCLGKIIGG